MTSAVAVGGYRRDRRDRRELQQRIQSSSHHEGENLGAYIIRASVDSAIRGIQVAQVNAERILFILPLRSRRFLWC